MSNTQSSPPRPFNIVAGFDFSKLGDRAFTAALADAAQRENAELHAITVATAEGDSFKLKDADGETRVLSQEDAQEMARAHIADLVGEYQEEFGNVGLEKIGVYIVTGSASERILALSRKVDADLIVVGTHGRSGIKRLVLGSVAEQVLKGAECGVYVVRPRDFYKGEAVPEVQEPLKPGQHSIHPFEHRPTYHYVDRISKMGGRMMPTY